VGAVTSDLKWRLSTQSGSAGNTTASTPADSIGKWISTTDVVDASVENLFANVSRADAGTGKAYYRCLFLYNAHATGAMHDAVVWIASQLAGGGDVSIGLDPAGVVAAGSGSAQAAAPADQYTEPAGVTFSNPTSQEAALAVGDLDAGECAAVWLRLIVQADAAAVDLDNALLQVDAAGDP
jgi:hypothetical protein